jgi:hypothetical protein
MFPAELSPHKRNVHMGFGHCPFPSFKRNGPAEPPPKQPGGRGPATILVTGGRPICHQVCNSTPDFSVRGLALYNLRSLSESRLQTTRPTCCQVPQLVLDDVGQLYGPSGRHAAATGKRPSGDCSRVQAGLVGSMLSNTQCD